MKLVDVTFRKFCRFHDTKLRVDAPLVALVGPNEAGKSSLLRGLTLFDDAAPVEDSDVERGETPSAGEPLVTLRFALSPEEKSAALSQGLSSAPRWFVLEKRRNGQRGSRLEPETERDRSYRQQLLIDMRDELLKPEVTEALEQHGEFAENVHSVMGTVEQDPQNPEVILDRPSALLILSSAGRGKELARLKELFTHLWEEESRDSDAEVRRWLRRRVPRFLLFEHADRDLRSSYPISALQEPPRALANLLALSGTDPHELHQAILAGEHGDRSAMQERANERLRERLVSWGQSDVYVRLLFDKDDLHVMVKSVGTYSRIAERSDGLRWFVAMHAFVHKHGSDQSIILLIDEAETHLHYDAQADLVRVLGAQSTAATVLYTTHSAGCLPEDLGTGIRAVEPQVDESGRGTGRSTVINSVWSRGPGFSPLLLAMGAEALAMTPARRAVFTEGPSDMILLPSLLREASAVEKLGFQMVPGLASLSRREVESLDLEAARICCLLDGDDAGRLHGKKLRKGGFKKEKICVLPEGHTTEDFIEERVFIDAFNQELIRSSGPEVLLAAGLPSEGRTAFLKKWCEDEGVAEPSRRNVAANVVNQEDQGRCLVEPAKKTVLRDLHRRIEEALGLQAG